LLFIRTKGMQLHRLLRRCGQRFVVIAVSKSVPAQVPAISVVRAWQQILREEGGQVEAAVFGAWAQHILHAVVVLELFEGGVVERRLQNARWKMAGSLRESGDERSGYLLG